MSTEPVMAVTASYEQQRLLLLEQLADDTALYNVHFAFRWYGEVAVDVLRSALDTLVARHEVLRTTFRPVAGVPQQIIAERLAVPLRHTRRTDVAPAAREDEALRLAAAHARAPFDLATGPLLRADLVSFSATEHAFLLTLHHTVFDGWSAGVLFDELTEAYAAEADGTAPRLDELPLQYADFGEWQQEMLERGAWEGQFAHWAERLGDAPAVLELPTDRPRPAVQTFRGELVELALPPSVEDAMAAACRRYRCTRFGTLLAAFAVLLHRLTGSDDLVIGTVDAGRNRVELERLIGLFTSTLALRVPVRGTEPFSELLGTVRSLVAEAQSNADVPFARLVERLRPARAHSHNPLFQVMFDVQPGGAHRLRLPGVRSEPLRVRDRGISLFDLSLSVETDESGSRLVAEFATDLFDRATVTGLLESYRTLLTGLLAEPDRPVDEAPLLTEESRAALLDRYDRTSETAPAPSVTELIARRLRESGAAPAIVHPDGSALTYRQLDLWSGDIASVLAKEGVRPGASVALLLPRSAEGIAAILGVLRAGASYLPLDPDQPRARNEAILDAARPAAVLAADGALAGLATGAAAAVTLPPPPRAPRGEPPAWYPARREDLAYTLFTSGSTGAPKGVMVTRGGLDTYVAADLDTYRLTDDDRVLMFTALTFDVSAEELFPALAAGAALVLRTERMLETPADFFTECERLGVTVTHLPTAWFHQLAAEVTTGTGPPDGLRAMAIGGEAPGPAQVAQWRAAVPRMLLTNVYGPTETTIVATIATLAGGQSPPPADGRMPLGEPIPGTSCYVLDHRMEPVAPGAIGELHLGGAGLARGYLADPARTADAFVPHPFVPGQRLYRTGDLARLTPDGELEFRGRTDQQLKIRGYRVEPGEVEAALLRFPEVSAAVVVPHRDRASLVAYLVAARGARLPDEPALLAGLAEVLPAYLMPSAFVPLPELPLSTHHKIDRAALPEPPAATAVPPGAAPVGRTEQTVARVWQEVLGVPEVGRYDNFFALGGHSLLATQVISRLRRDYGGRVRLAPLFQRPVLSEFAATLDRDLAAAAPARPALVPRAGRDADSISRLTAGMSEAGVAALLGAADAAVDGRSGSVQGEQE
ncbi:amino acid adenylation domain-containing protein [Streptomyces aurantiacus]